MTPEDRARQSAHAMLARDNASRWLGLTLESVEPGLACMSLQLRDEHLNGHGICHGGVIFTLADTAFAVACNSRNKVAVAQHNTISYVSPGRAGERLTATAREISLTGRSGVTDVTVTGADGRVVALFRGASRQIEGVHFDETGGDA